MNANYIAVACSCCGEYVCKPACPNYIEAHTTVTTLQKHVTDTVVYDVNDIPGCPDMLERDVFVYMPPKKSYTINATLTRKLPGR